MKVESASYEAYLAAMEEWKQKMQQMQAAQTEENSETDSYVASIGAEDMPMPTGTYDAQGMMVGERPPMPPMAPVEQSAETDTESESDLTSGEQSLLAQLSETFRANTDSILMKMEELGLSLEDLQDEDNLTKLAEAMNEGAESLGLPTIEDMDTVVSELYEKLSANWTSYFDEEQE